MPTDDELTTELAAAFRTRTEHLQYAGRRRPRRSSPAVLPVAATAAVGAVAAVAIATSGTGQVTPAPAVTERPSASPSPSTRTVAASLDLAGFHLSYRRAVGAPDPLHAELRVGRVPADARKVVLHDSIAHAWVGTGPRTGDNAVWVQSPSRNRGHLFVLLSSSWSQEQLVTLLRRGSARAVPLVTN